MKPLRNASISLVAATLLAASTARAQTPAPDKIAQASSFFDSGAQAYKAGQYLVAAEAFLKANELAPSASLLFSAAQAYRRQFLAEPQPTTLRRAVSLYREYLRLDKNARRREDAMQALSALAPFEARFPEDSKEAAPKEPPSTTRLLLTSPAEGAEVSVDGGPFVLAPAVVQVRPGPRHVRVRAPGYVEDQIMMDAIANELVPRHLPLRPKPARVSVTGTSGAKVAVDGQVRGTLPLAQAITVDPGAHFVSVSLSGHEPFGHVVELARDGTIDLDARLPLTRRRVAAWSTLGVGAAGVVASGVLAGFAFARQSEASSLEERRTTNPPLSTDDRDRYNSALRGRDDFTRAAAIAGGVSVLTLATGLALYALDKPEIITPNDERLKAPARPGPSVQFEIGAASFQIRGVF
jgi:hypothetical protein